MNMKPYEKPDVKRILLKGAAVRTDSDTDAINLFDEDTEDIVEEP